MKLRESKIIRFSTRLTETQSTKLKLLGEKYAPSFLKMTKKEFYTDAEYFDAVLAFADRQDALLELAKIEAHREKKPGENPIINSKLTAV